MFQVGQSATRNRRRYPIETGVRTSCLLGAFDLEVPAAQVYLVGSMASGAATAFQPGTPLDWLTTPDYSTAVLVNLLD